MEEEEEGFIVLLTMHGSGHLWTASVNDEPAIGRLHDLKAFATAARYELYNVARSEQVLQ